MAAFGTLIQIREDNDATDPNTVAYASNVVAGNLLVAYVSSGNGVNVTAVDSQSNTWAEAVQEDVPAFGSRQSIKYAIAGTSGANTVTFSGGASAIIFILEFQGPFMAAPFSTGAGDNGATTSSQSGNFTPGADGALLCGYHLSDVDLTEAGGWTVDDDSTFPAGGSTLCAHTVQALKAAVSSSATLGAGVWMAIAASFLPATVKQRVEHIAHGIGRGIFVGR